MDELKVLRAAVAVLQDAQSWSFESDGPDFSNYCAGVLDLATKLTTHGETVCQKITESDGSQLTESHSPDGYGVGIYA